MTEPGNGGVAGYHTVGPPRAWMSGMQVPVAVQGGFSLRMPTFAILAQDPTRTGIFSWSMGRPPALIEASGPAHTGRFKGDAKP
jgi:hypothetical protein